MHELRTVEEVVAALGGPKEVARLTQRTPKGQSTYNWLVEKSFPNSTYVRLQQELHKRGFTAPLDLWRFE